MAEPPPPGIYVPVPTFFSKPASEEGIPELDLATQTKHSLHLANSGIKGLVLLGSTGEAIAVTNSERQNLISHIRQEMNKAGYEDYPIIAGTATQGIEDTITQLQISKDAGAQWGLVLAPGFFATCITQQGLKEWYLAIANRSPMPILIYHYPAVSNSLPLSASTITSLSSHPNICGAKLSHGDLSLHTQLASSPLPSMAHDKFATFTGLGQQLLPVLIVGGAGAIDGLAAIFPKTMVKLYELIKKGDVEEARNLQEIVARGEGLVVGHGVVGVKEGVRRVLEWDSEARLPLVQGMGEEKWREWEGVVGELRELEESTRIAADRLITLAHDHRSLTTSDARPIDFGAGTGSLTHQLAAGAPALPTLATDISSMVDKLGALRSDAAASLVTSQVVDMANLFGAVSEGTSSHIFGMMAIQVLPAPDKTGFWHSGRGCWHRTA
ncbi:MAG: hypothetical protein Q9166_000861 [cf. Caloplaca sp. 2 TL-2023]